jgi:RND family efflux transporter MFP subunit
MAFQYPFSFYAPPVTLSLALLISGCGGAQSQGAPQAPPPSAVSITTLEEAPIQESSDFIATLRSLRSTTVQPDVDGLITRIFVKAGQRVSVGTPLVQINAERQAAAVQATQANVSGAEADVKYWQQQVKRLATLVEAGAVSKAEYDQAQTSLQTAESRLSTLSAQVREARVGLTFYRVEAPQAGILGDIPVRVGDRVTTSTQITTIDDRQGIEAYIQVPLDRSPDLKLGLPVEILDADGKPVSSNRITFIAPRVDDQTQTVLVKSLLQQVPDSIRVLQFIRTRIIWRDVPGLKVPVTAVTRVSGQYFCFVAEKNEQGALVARQRPIEVGQMVGNDYVVRSGLKPGEQLITAGIQKIGDGAPVAAQAQ